MNNEYLKKIYDPNVWLEKHIKQLSYARNMILLFAVSALGFSLSYYQKVPSRFIISGCILLLFSIFCGMAIALLESRNYRLKWKIGRLFERKNINEDNAQFLDLQRHCDKIERLNRILLVVQLATFLIAIIFIASAFLRK